MKRHQNISSVIRASMHSVFAYCLFLLIPAGTAYSQLVPNLGGQRSGISSLQFLKIGADARGAGMAEAYIAVVNDVGAVFWNPAGLTNLPTNQALFSHTEWLIDLNHEFAAASLHIDEANVLGLSFISLSTDPMKITTEYQPEGTGEYFRYGDMAVGATYARKMTDQFSIGATVKYVRETIANIYTDGVLIDLGTYYYMGLGSSRFSVVVTNFGNNLQPHGTVVSADGTTYTSFQDFSPPTLFKLGYAFEPYEDAVHRVTATIQLNHPNDNAENVRLGVEYGYDKTLYLRAGVKRTIGESIFDKSTSTAEDYAFGIGIQIPLGITVANVDYAFANYNELGSVQRISIAMTY